MGETALMKTSGEKKGYARAIKILEEEYILRKPLHPEEQMTGFILALNLLRLYSGREFPGEKKWRRQP